MPLNQLYKVTDNQRLPSGEPIENVYFYHASVVGGTAQDLLDNWVSQVLDDVRGVQSNQLVHGLVECENIGDVSDFAEYSVAGVVGASVGAVRNEWDAFCYTLRPSIRSVRPGSKRIGGVPESDGAYTNGVVTDAGLLTMCQNLRAAMGQNVLGASATYVPTIVKRVLDGTTYRLPETDLEYVGVPVAVALFNTKIGHQISRGNAR